MSENLAQQRWHGAAEKIGEKSANDISQTGAAAFGDEQMMGDAIECSTDIAELHGGLAAAMRCQDPRRHLHRHQIFT